MSDETPTPSEVRHAAHEAPKEGRLALLEQIMSSIDGMIHTPDPLTLESLDSNIGELAGSIVGLAALMHAEIGEEE